MNIGHLNQKINLSNIQSEITQTVSTKNEKDTKSKSSKVSKNVETKVKAKYFKNCFEAYWKNNLDISVEKNIKEILKISEINEINFFEKISQKKVKDDLKRFTDIAFEKNIFGAPTFVVNDKIFWGQDRLEYALDEYNSYI